MNFSFYVAFFVAFFSLFLSDVWAIDSKSDREKIVTAKSRKFYRSSRAKKSLLFSGNYSSDWNSKEYQIDSRFFYQNESQIHEIYFLHEVNYADSGSGSNKQYLVKKSDHFDVMLSNKFLLFKSNNYAAIYNRFDQDYLANYYHDIRNAAGLGRLFLKDKLELDLSFGINENKLYGQKHFLLPSFRANLQLSEKISLMQRGFFFVNNESSDTDIRTSIKYRLNKSTSFAINHTFEQRRYFDKSKDRLINQASRNISFGFIFDLE